MAAGQFPRGTDQHVACHVLWAAIHGPAVISLSGLTAPTEDPDTLARDTFEAALTGLRYGSSTTFAAAACPMNCPCPLPGATHETV